MNNRLANLNCQLLSKESLPPNLNEYVSRGYNIVESNFMSDQIFELVFDKSKSDSDQYTIPKGCIFQENHDSTSTSNTLVLENEADYNEKMSLGFGVEYTGTLFSAGASSSLEYTGNLFKSDSKFYTLNQILQCSYLVKQIEEELTLSPEFKEALDHAPQGFSSDDYKQWKSIFDRFGTHYLAAGAFGGAYIMESDIEMSLLQSFSSDELEGEIHAGFNALVSSGEISVSSAYENSEFLKNNSKSISIIIKNMGGEALSNIEDWRKSVFNHPTLLTTPQDFLRDGVNLKTFEFWIGNEATKQSYLHALMQYIAKYQTRNGFIGSRQSRSSNVEHNAFEDGYLFVIANQNNSFKKNLSQIAATPDQTIINIVSQVSAIKSTDMITLINTSSLVPIKKGDYYLVHSDRSNVSNNWFYGFGSAPQALLGKCKCLDIENKMIDIDIRQDGFILYSAGENECVSFEYKCSEYNYQMNVTGNPLASLTMPVKKGGRLKSIKSEITKDVRFVPINDDILCSPVERNVGIEYTALTSGLVTVSLGNNFNRQSNEISFQVRDLVTNQMTELYKVNPALSGGSSFTCPVLKGQNYKVECGDINLTFLIHYFGITK